MINGSCLFFNTNLTCEFFMINKLKSSFERIMIIDDDDVDAYVFSKLISKNNFAQNILKYNSAEKALNYIIENKENQLLMPQIIFLDIYMPNMNGFEFLENLKKVFKKTIRNCKIIIVSSSIDDSDISRVKLDNCISLFAVKPVTKKIFEDLISL